LAAFEASPDGATLEWMKRTCFETLAELFERDIDRELLRRACAKTPTERLAWLEEMQAFADQAKKAQGNEAPGAAREAG
jgi:hypothetical protein